MKQKINWWLDVLLFSAFIFTFFMDISGLALHQWLGIAVFVISMVHLILHWDWIMAIGRRFFTKTTPKARIYALLDAALLAGLGLIVLSGLVISTWLNLSLDNASAWLALHIIISISTLLVLAVKLALHWRWLVRMLRSFQSRQPVTAVKNPVMIAAQIPAARMNRRDFVKISAVVGAASLLAMVSATKGLAALAQPSSDSLAGTLNTQESSSSKVRPGDRSYSLSDSDSSCRVQCNRRCSYPGHCRRYVDSNQNKRCDLGECA